MRKSSPCLKSNVFVASRAVLLFQICSVFEATAEFLPFSYIYFHFFFQLLIPMSIPSCDLVVCIRTLAALDLGVSSREHHFTFSFRSLGELTPDDLLVLCLWLLSDIVLPL